MNKLKHITHSVFSSLTKNTPTAIIVAAIMLSLSHVAYGVIIQKKSSSGTFQPFAGAPVTEKDYPTGKVKSDVIVVEYSDTQCPFCAQVQPTMKRLQEEYASKVAFVYRYFPLTSIHPDAFGEAKAVDCVGKLAGGEKRRDYINKIFEYKTSQKNMVLKKGDTVTFAKELGVDEQQFTTCVNNPETDAIVNSALQDGVNAGVQGTPASMVLKKKGDRYELVAFIDGARQYDYFKAAIEEALSR